MSLNERSILTAKFGQPTDSEPLAQIRCGCEQSFNALFYKYWEKAYADAFKQILDKDKPLP